jgi:hypothetical protein
MSGMSQPAQEPRSHRRYWIMLVAVPVIAAVLLLALLVLVGEADRDSFVYTLF